MPDSPDSPASPSPPDSASAEPAATAGATAPPLVAGAPRLTEARAPLVRAVTIVDECGTARAIHIPLERPLTVYVDKREVVTLMTLGARPELLVLGYLLHQRLIGTASELESITVDWEVGAAAVKTHAGSGGIERRTVPAGVATGRGQDTVFGELLARLAAVRLPDPGSARLGQGTLQALLELMRQLNGIHKQAGSVHGCALFRERELLFAIEDVGRHNAIDTIAGWMAMHGVGGADKVFYTTGRLTSEMVMKAAHMGVPIVVSRNGITAMGHTLATRLGMTLIGRATRGRFLCYTGVERFDAEPAP